MVDDQSLALPATGAEVSSTPACSRRSCATTGGPTASTRLTSPSCWHGPVVHLEDRNRSA
ncbi:hypothetical protein HBB16_13285 [Pseudonocardia sp. MCCB 268]|nr:hypothetical protein [Pseudonocardia cytotoxica]